MLPSRHFTFGILFALVLLFIFPKIGFIGFFLIVISTVVIDVDHYLYYIFRKKNFSFRKFFDWVSNNGNVYSKLSEKQRKKIYFEICIFHGLETIFILFFILLFSKSSFILFILTGLIFHQALDLIDLIHLNINPCKVISLIYSVSYSKDKIFFGDYKLK